MTTRRRALLYGLGAAAARLAAAPRTGMGIATTSYMTVWRPKDTLEFLEHCHTLGAGGIQAALASTEAAYLKQLRRRLDETGMYLEVMIGLPRAGAEMFERTVAAAKEAGAICVRAACLGGRRYETFGTLTDWQRFVTDSRDAVSRALSIVEKHKLPLALENHKDWTADEMAALIRDKSSEYLGVCLDLGNNMALLDDAMELVEKLAPYAISTHIKDMDVEPYEDGFLLSEVPLGEGMLDLKRMIALIRKHHPKTKMSLEMITRDPLKIPCLTDKFWATFPDRGGR
ncbi:MAG: sugar phosphate isomerase/epimerase family protein, partial [Bryobacteraceae bacterium]